VGSRNGNIRKSLELGRQLSPQDVDTLRLGRAEVLLGLAESDKERRMVEECLASGWEERPTQTRLYNRLALRVVNEEERQVLARAEGFRILLPEAMPERRPIPSSSSSFSTKRRSGPLVRRGSRGCSVN
jgi:hypothetical protein